MKPLAKSSKSFTTHIHSNATTFYKIHADAENKNKKSKNLWQCIIIKYKQKNTDIRIKTFEDVSSDEGLKNRIIKSSRAF